MLLFSWTKTWRSHYPDHRRPPYLEEQINDVFIRRALVDMGSSVNILPLYVLTAAGIPLSKIVQSQTSISGFGNKSEVTIGYIQVNLKVGPIQSLTKFYVVDMDVAYHALLGRPWLNKHKLVVSTYHKCVKGRIGLRPLCIPRNQALFNKNEAHNSEAEFYTECTGTRNPSKDFGTYLPSWTEIHDLSNEELITIVDRERNRHSEVWGLDRVLQESPKYGEEVAQMDSHKSPKDKTPMPCAFQEPMMAPMHMQDGLTAVVKQLEAINLSDDPFIQRPISISIHLTSEEKKALASLLKEFRDVFAWSYEEMPGLNPNLVSHTLNIDLGTKPVVQPRRNFHSKIENQIKVEIEKLLAARFIKPIKHPTWLANTVPMKKKIGVIRICTDYQDLNRACPKDEFPLPNMDILIDSTSGQGLLSFMDGFSGYNQIKMSPKDPKRQPFEHHTGISITQSCHSVSRMLMLPTKRL
ncbi:hypothetical protein L3X38_017144 [Prunus dulcis]|uniref:Transposable element protein n=1 Tax=Prunus dulcis TaxID=3755 RepID=A0AAD4W7L0_PRUDU|nr:hypothetical protein L3X38_017144 [Prunus dulcis]